MEEWQERQIEERDELANKINKLAAFMSDSGKMYEMVDKSSVFESEYVAALRRQMNAMQEYMAALDLQIALWK